MQIDNYEEAQSLNDRLEATIPFQVRLNKGLIATMRNKGDKANADTIFSVDLVKYSGDLGGINCGLVSLSGQPEAADKYIVSITHLKIDPTHPLAAEVKTYQQTRIQRLKLQQTTGFAAELLAQGHAPKSKATKGFGK